MVGEHWALLNIQCVSSSAFVLECEQNVVLLFVLVVSVWSGSRVAHLAACVSVFHIMII